jgi:hypothetical protein
MATSPNPEVTGTASVVTEEPASRVSPLSCQPTPTSITPETAGDAIPDTNDRAEVAMRETIHSPRGSAKNTLVFSPKDRIDNPYFGLGTIVTIDTHYITIKFDEAGTRKFLMSKVKLAPSDKPKPVRRVPARNKVKQKPA